MRFLVSETYQQVTPESAKHGDYSETGFIFEDQVYTLSELKDYIRSEGYSRDRNMGCKKSSPCSAWMETDSYYADLSNGTLESKSLHVTLITNDKKGDK